MKTFTLHAAAMFCLAAVILAATVTAPGAYGGKTLPLQPMQMSDHPCPVCGQPGSFTGQTISTGFQIYYIYECPRGHMWRVPA